MQFTFLDMAGTVLFTRDDAERAIWTVEEMTLELEFPYIQTKAVSIGQRVFFKDPATGNHEIYEIRQAKTYQPDAYQSIVAENICVSELSDEHINDSEIDNQSCSGVLGSVLSGTLWSVGNVEINPTSSVDLSRGSVWQAVLQIKDNWNVYIEPRIIFNSDQTITRYLDIKRTSGEWHGVRLSIDKNMLDPSVTYDDTNVATALYGYGGTITSSDPEKPNTECDFSGVAWAATDEHPAKPKGQKYLEDPAATAAYGRNGRPRFGFYQNNDITDSNLLLQKTWETLKTVSSPDISIEGTVEDLYRLGYADQPIKLHDIALIEINPNGFKTQRQIIRLTVDLLDPSATTLTIGAYIPNIIYIERATNESATGSRGGGGGNSSKTTTAWREYVVQMQQINNGTGLRIESIHNDVEHQEAEIMVQTGRIDIAYNKINQEVIDRRNSDNVLAGRITVEANRITQEVTERKNGYNTLEGRITVEANRITQEVINRQQSDNVLSGRITTEANKISLVVTEYEGENVVNTASIVAGINDQTGSYVKIKADTINLSGYVTASQLSATNATITNLTNGTTTAASIKTNALSASSSFSLKGHTHNNSNITSDGVTYNIVTWS